MVIVDLLNYGYNEGCGTMEELLKQIRISAPNLVNICIDKVQNENLEGRLYHKYNKSAMEFHSISGMLNEMEKLFDWIQFPQAATRQRTFFEDRESAVRQKEAVQVTAAKDLLGYSGDKATFVVHVRYRQNATWQGDILWAEKKKKLHFRSALELLKLIDSALDEEGIDVVDTGSEDNEKKGENR